MTSVSVRNDNISQSLVSENVILQQKVTILNQLVAENTKKCRSIVSENEKLQIQCKFNEKSLHEYEQTLKSYEKSQKDTQLQSMKSSLNELEAKYNALLIENSESQNVNKSLNIKMKKMNSDNILLKEKNENYEHQFSTMQHQLIESANTINHLNISIYDLKQKFEFESNEYNNNHNIMNLNGINNLHSIKIPITLSNIPKYGLKDFTTDATDDASPIIARFHAPDSANLHRIKEHKAVNSTRNSLNAINSNDLYIDYDGIHYVDYDNDEDDDKQTPIPSQEVGDIDIVSAYFGDDNADGYNVWSNVCDTAVITMDTLGRYSVLYPIICRVFIEKTECSRVPTAKDLKVFVTKSNIATTVRCEEFLKFWTLFKECCDIVKELKYLWDFENNNLFLCNLFCGRDECLRILNELTNGTFVIRLSSTVKGGVVLTHFETEEMDQKRVLKHSLFIRRAPNKYEKSRKKTENERADLNSLSNIIRSFHKIQYLYTPNRIYLKKTVF